MANANTYKLMRTETIIEDAAVGRRGNKIPSAKLENVVVDTGLTWEDAQEARRKDSRLVVVREGMKHEHSNTGKAPKGIKAKASKKRLRRGKTASQKS